MAASSVEAMHSIDELLDKIAVGFASTSLFSLIIQLFRQLRILIYCPVLTTQGKSIDIECYKLLILFQLSYVTTTTLTSMHVSIIK